jgi:ElaB/YqjD/DUF883 family membrane-anchored ribosome-binding protein
MVQIPGGVVKGEPPSVLAARAEVEIARKRMIETLNELQSQFAPRALVREAWETAREKGAELAEETVDAVRSRPLAATGVVAAITMFLAREPLMGLAGKLFDGNSEKRKARKRRKAKTKEDDTEAVE